MNRTAACPPRPVLTPAVALVLALAAAAGTLLAGEDPHAERRDVPARDGFPPRFDTSPLGGEIRGVVVTADLDGDGKKEIVFGSIDGSVHVFREDGREVRTGFWPRHTGGPIVGGVRVGDLNGDGEPEVIAVSYNGKVHAFDHQGARRWAADTGTAGLSSTPVLAGEPGSDERRVLFTTADGTLHALNRHGHSDWKHRERTPIGATPVETDLDGDGQKEILLRNDAGVYVTLDTQGQERRRWPSSGYLERDGPAPFTVGDVDGDGILEVVGEQRESLRAADVARAPGAENAELPAAHETGVFVWDARGRMRSAFAAEADLRGPPRLADADGDGRREVLFANDEGWLESRTIEGEPLPSSPIDILELYRHIDDHEIEMDGKPRMEKPPLPVDVDGDGAPELVFTLNDPRQKDVRSGMLWALRPDGTPIHGFPKYIGRNHGDLVVSDLDDDGDMELIVPGGAGSTGPHLYVFNLPASQRTEMILLGSDLTVESSAY